MHRSRRPHWVSLLPSVKLSSAGRITTLKVIKPAGYNSSDVLGPTVGMRLDGLCHAVPNLLVTVSVARVCQVHLQPFV